MLEGYGRDSEGSFQRFFDDRDDELSRLRVIEGSDATGTTDEDLKEWITVILNKKEGQDLV